MPESAVALPPVGATPAGTPPPSSAPGPENATGSSMNDAFASLDKTGGDLAKTANEPPPSRKQSAPPKTPAKAIAEKPPEKPLEKPSTDKPAEKPVETGKPQEKPATAEKPKSGWERFHEAERENKKLRAQLEAKEKASDLPNDHPEFVRLRSEIETRQKRLDEVENHLRFKDYEASKEYKEQYHQPYLKTAEEATRRATQLKLTDEGGTTRPLTPEEFWKIVHIDDADSAINAAEKMFGEGSAKANFVIERRNEILAAHQRAESAKAEFRKTAQERAQKEQADFQRLGQERSTLFKRLINEGIEKDATLYKPEEGDTEGNALLEQGYKRVDQVFRGGAPEEDGGTPLSPQEMISAHAEIRNNAAAFPRLAHKYKAAIERIKALETEIDQYEKSAPGKGEGADAQRAEGKTWESELEGIAEN